MDSKKTKYLVWLLGFMIFLSCLVGIGFWLLVDSTGSISIPLQGEITLVRADDLGSPDSRPEIDLQTPETTEIALFALG
ncbi:MAG: hypothetical protein KAG12_11105 [Desulfuromusa sp.]|nr:hypothetical protein [Desulfuromusa sp.]